jgi:hypothetical protein
VNSKILGVVAIHTFDSDSIGDPSTDTGTSPDPNWLGHDIIDAQDVKISSYFTNSPITNDEGIKLYRHNTFEFVVNWKKYGGSSYKWTAYGSHLGTTDAKYTLMDISDGATRDFYTKGPTLLVNGQPAAGTYGHTATDIDYGNIYTGNSITLYAEGFGNFDPADAIGVDDNVLGLNHTVSISKNGIGLQTEMVWFDDGEISTLYSPTLTPEESEQGYVIFPPDTKRYPMLSDYEVHGVSCIELHYDENDKVAVTLSGTAPMSEVFEKGGATEAKLYFRPNLASTHPSGSSPLLGDHYFFGGYLSVKIAFIHPDYLSPEGVDFIDYSFFADHWMLTDCNETNDCDSTDLNFSGSVDSKDFEIFKGYWLSGK